MNDGTILFENPTMKVTPSIIRFNNQSYPVSGVTSVTFGKNSPYRLPGYVAIVLGAIASAIGPGAASFFILIGAAWLVSVQFIGRYFVVALSTSAGEVRALTTKSEEEARTAVEAIEKAVETR